MTQGEAIALAEKRERHKSKFMSYKEWKAIHDSVRGWHVALVDRYGAIALTQREKARRAYLAGDMQEFLDAASAALMAGIRAELDNSPTHQEPPHAGE